MEKIIEWLLRSIFKNLFKQGFYHKNNIKEVYALIREVCEEEFTEDNAPTMDDFLRELFESTQHKSLYKKELCNE